MWHRSAREICLNSAAAESEKLLGGGSGITACLPKQVKLCAERPRCRASAGIRDAARRPDAGGAA